MRYFIIWYRPIWGNLNRISKTIRASSKKQAEIKFYGCKEADNCDEILIIEDCKYETNR